jgi:hypothetical protein
MKLHLIYSFLLIFLLTSQIAAYSDDGDTTQSTTQDSGNPYANDKKVKHSLFLDKNLWNRVSGGEQGVPMKNL